MKFSLLEQRAQSFASDLKLVLRRCLGHGVQGIVFQARDQDEGEVAIKVHDRRDAYERERDVYLRLRELDIEQIQGSKVPQCSPSMIACKPCA